MWDFSEWKFAGQEKVARDGREKLARDVCACVNRPDFFGTNHPANCDDLAACLNRWRAGLDDEEWVAVWDCWMEAPASEWVARQLLQSACAQMDGEQVARLIDDCNPEHPRSPWAFVRRHVADFLAAWLAAGGGPVSAPAVHRTAWSILRAMRDAHPQALDQAEIGDRADPKLSRATVGRWLDRLRGRGLTRPLTGGGEELTPDGLRLARGGK
jgi:hypothetical protein